DLVEYRHGRKTYGFCSIERERANLAAFSDRDPDQGIASNHPSDGLPCIIGTGPPQARIIDRPADARVFDDAVHLRQSELLCSCSRPFELFALWIANAGGKDRVIWKLLPDLRNLPRKIVRLLADRFRRVIFNNVL